MKKALAVLLWLLWVLPCRADATATASPTASSTNASVVAGVSGKKIVVTGLVLQNGASATSVTLRSKPSGTGTDLTPAFTLGASGQLVLPYRSDGWFSTVAGEALTATTSSGSTVAVLVTYRLKE